MKEILLGMDIPTRFKHTMIYIVLSICQISLKVTPSMIEKIRLKPISKSMPSDTLSTVLYIISSVSEI